MEAPDVFQEIADGQGFSLQDAARLLPSSRRGRPTHFSTVFRWVLKGIRLPGDKILKLEAARLGGKWVTTKAALVRFMAAQTPDIGQSRPMLRVRTPAQRARDQERVERHLDERLGYKHCKVCDGKIQPSVDGIPYRKSFVCAGCLLKQPDTTFAQRLKACRMRSRLRQRDLASTSGVSYSKISSYEQGQLREPRAADLDKLVAALGPELVHGTTTS